MAIAPIYLNGIISATGDIGSIRAGDDAKAAAMQSSTEATVEEEADHHVNQVINKDNADGPSSESDASGGSRNQYAGDGGRNRKKKEDGDSFGKVVTKHQGGFNITI